MREPERRTPPEDSGRVTRAAVLRPINLLTLLIGVGFSLITGFWWILPLTVATYAALVTLAARDPVFQHRVLEGRETTPRVTQPNSPGSRSQEVSPERRARWLPRGETRQRVEEALVAYRKVVSVLEQSDDVTRTILEDTTPKLHSAADRLVDVARRREEAAAEIQEINRRSSRSRNGLTEDLATTLSELEDELRNADAEISSTIEKFQELRARIVRISISDSSAARTEASILNSSLDEMNLRLDALGETLPSDRHPPER